MRFPEVLFVPLLAAAVDARACKAKRPTTTAALVSTAVATSTSTLPTITTAVTSNSVDVSSAASWASSSIVSSSTAPESSSSSETLVGSSTSVLLPTSTATSLSSSVASTPSTAVSLSSSSVSPSATSTSTTTTSASSSTSVRPAPTAAPYRAYTADAVDKLRDSSISKLESFTKRNPAASCSLENASIRREWSDLSIAERESYISAVKCLQRLPAKTPSNVAPGARSRFDDFLTVHIQQTPSIHSTANFLGWHRYYVWAYEKALRDECGYQGYQPYWNWNREVADPTRSALFNGNATSLSGNSPRKGACVDSGPFQHMVVNLGPGASLNYNPRCLKRDISPSQASACTAERTLSLIQNSPSIGRFQDTMQAVPGVHAGGHFAIGGDPGSDIYTSAGDPAFYFHHAMIDRVWWLWQLQDLETRLTAVDGNNGGRRGSVNDATNLGLVGESVPLGELLNTMGGKGGEFCYIYV